MPHSKRKKKENHRPKRIEITDDEGWTHVTSTTPARPHRDLKANPGFNWNDDAVGWKRMVEEAPPNVTLEKLLGQYKRCEKRFRESSCWKRFEKDLQQRLSDRSTVDNCVCFGLGSPSAPSYQLDRRDVSLYQLAAFKAITELLRKVASILYAAQAPYHPANINQSAVNPTDHSLPSLKNPSSILSTSNSSKLYQSRFLRVQRGFFT